MTLSEFFASQQAWYGADRCAELFSRTRLAIADYSTWAAGDPDIKEVTLDSISAYEAIDESRKRMRRAQALRTVRRRYLAVRKAGEAIVVPEPMQPQPVVTQAIEPAPDPGSQPGMSLNYLAQLYVVSNPRLRSKHSKTLMLQAFSRFQEFLAREGTLADLSDQSLVAFANYRKTLGRSDRTIERELSKLSTVWRYAGRHGWCALVNFSVQKCAKPTPTAWSPGEMEKILKAATEYRSTCGGLPANLVLTAALRLAYDTGERRNAIFAVLWSDIDLSRRYVTYRGETRKGGARAADNLQRFSRKTRDALTELRKQATLLGKEGGRVFPEVHVTAVYGHLKLVLKSCGLDAGRNCMFHKIRRTHATHLYLAGGDPTQSLGHDSDAMTRGYYLDPRYTRNGFFADLVGVRGIFARLGRTLKRAFGII
jgi:integrase